MSPVRTQRARTSLTRTLTTTLATTLLLLVGMMWLTSAAASAAPNYLFLNSFGPKGLNAKGGAAGKFYAADSVAVDQRTGDVYVYDPDAVYNPETKSAKAAIYKFNAAGEPSDFSALGTNVITGSGGEGEGYSEIAVDSSSGPTSGDIYVATGKADSAVRIFAASGSPLGELPIGEVTAHGGTGAEEAKVFAGSPCGVAVDTSGNVYVAEDEVVYKYTPTANPVSKSDRVGSLYEAKVECSIAVDAAGDVYTSLEGTITKYAPSQFSTAEEVPVQGGTTITDTAGEAATLAVDPVSGELFVDEGEGIAQFDAWGGALGSFAERGKGALKESFGLAAAGANGELYVDSGEEEKGHVEIFAPATTPPTLTISPPTEIGKNSATFDGTVDPNGFPVNYHFEYSTDGVHWSALADVKAGEGTSALAASESAKLTGNTTYRVRLVATNGPETVSSEEATFSTLPAAPQVFGTVASQLSGSEATLSATIYPENEPTSYQFQYGTSASYGASAPISPEAITSPQKVAVRLGGLQPDTTYHFRVLATNTSGSTTNADQTFTTGASGEGEAPAAGGCPNEAVRRESDTDPLTGLPYSLALPDCRAYEQVTPAFKDGARLGLEGGIGDSRISAVSADGSPLEMSSASVLESPNEDPGRQEEVGRYELTREASGWSTKSLYPPASELPVAYLDTHARNALNAGLGIWAAATALEPENLGTFYVRETSGGPLVEIGPISPASAGSGVPHGNVAEDFGYSLKYSEALATSANLSHVLFNIDSARSSTETSYLWPGDATATGQRDSLYEYVGTGHTGTGNDVPVLVGRDNHGSQISDCATGLGGVLHEFNSWSVAGIYAHAVSSAGTTVFFNAQKGGCAEGAAGPAADELYARIGDPGTTQTTVNLAASECDEANGASCDVTMPVSYQGAASDGSKVFFTSSQPLLATDKDTTNDIYECELPGDGMTPPPPTGIVNACPRLQGISLSGSSEGADVQSVVAISEEGTRVYYIATGVLTDTPNGEGRSAEPGKNNLYVWEAPAAGQTEGHTSFIATIATSSLAGPKIAQATPDGKYLAFTTTADLTLEDDSTAEQAFLYDAENGELVRISSGQEGFNEDGNTNTDAAHLAEYMTLSDDGSYVFFESNDALTPQVKGGLHNVYEWHDGHVYLISDGTDTDTNDFLIGTDASGSDVFFTTQDPLVAQDTDEAVDVYDARIDGGFPAPEPEASCSGEACQGPFGGSLSTPAIASTGAPSVGNAPPPPAAGVKGYKATTLTRAQKLKKALKACKKDTRKKKRQLCERLARKRYGPIKHKTKKKNTKASRRR